MTREEYIRERLRKRKMITYTIRACMLVLLVGTIGLICCGCLYAVEMGDDAPEYAAVLNQEEDPQDSELIQILESVEETASVENASMESSTVPENTVEEVPSEEEIPDDATVPSQSDESEASVGEKDKEGLLVVLDAGHGGNDSGTFSGEIYEKDITLAVVMFMKEKLTEHGIDVFLTRETDEYVGLKERTDMSNAKNPDVFVSIHCNYYEGSEKVHGMECYYQECGTDSQVYAEEIMEVIGEWGQIRNRGAKEENYHVTRCSNGPAVLIEMGFMSDPEDLAKLTDSEFQKEIAEKIVEGILAGMEEVS